MQQWNEARVSAGLDPLVTTYFDTPRKISESGIGSEAATSLRGDSPAHCRIPVYAAGLHATGRPEELQTRSGPKLSGVRRSLFRTHRAEIVATTVGALDAGPSPASGNAALGWSARSPRKMAETAALPSGPVVGADGAAKVVGQDDDDIEMVPTSVVSKATAKALQMLMPILDRMWSDLIVTYTGIQTTRG